MGGVSDVCQIRRLFNKSGHCVHGVSVGGYLFSERVEVDGISDSAGGVSDGAYNVLTR